MGRPPVGRIRLRSLPLLNRRRSTSGIFTPNSSATGSKFEPAHTAEVGPPIRGPGPLMLCAAGDDCAAVGRVLSGVAGMRLSLATPTPPSLTLRSCANLTAGAKLGGWPANFRAGRGSAGVDKCQ